MKRTQHKIMTLPGGLAIGIGVSAGITVILCAIMSRLILMGSISESSMDYVSLAILVGASIGGATSAAAVVKRRRLVVCVCSGGLYFSFLLGCNAMLFGGEYRAVMVTCLAVMASAVCAGLIGIGKSNHNNKKIRAYR